MGCEICRKISATIQTSTLLPGYSDAGIMGSVAWNQRAEKPGSWDPCLGKEALTMQLEKSTSPQPLEVTSVNHEGKVTLQ